MIIKAIAYNKIKQNINKILVTEIIKKKYHKVILNILKKEQTKKGVFFILFSGKCVFLIPPVPAKSIAESIRRLHFILNHTLRFVQTCVHNHTNDFYQEVKYLNIKSIGMKELQNT